MKVQTRTRRISDEDETDLQQTALALSALKADQAAPVDTAAPTSVAFDDDELDVDIGVRANDDNEKRRKILRNASGKTRNKSIYDRAV